MSYQMPFSEPIAVVGSGCRFAGGVTQPSALWELLKKPTDLTREIPIERFNIKAFYHKDGEYHGTTNSPKAYFLEQDHRVFDASFFNIAPKEAEAIDPQQRMTLEVVYEALESAGYTLHQYAGAKVAVFAGLMTGDYDTLSQRDELDTSQYYATGNARSILSNRISYYFNFNGPSMTIDTACSSSLVALHQAVLSLRSGECDMACVAGANLILTPEQFIVESNLHMLSPSGHCRMWDAGADGYARGEGVAAIFIKPLSKALKDGDNIKAIIRETGVNSDGRSRGITMPNWEAQSRLIQDTYQRAGLDSNTPRDRCQYFEAHGTGTSAGDPNEARAIENAFFGRDNSSIKSDTKLLVGSIKTVIGHTEGAAGLAGLLKVVESMRNNSVPPNLHLEKLNPEVEKFYNNLLVPTASTSWPTVPAGQPKRGSVNSFGFGGTNAHAIIEQYIPEIHDKVAKSFNKSLTEIPRSIRLASKQNDFPICIPLLLSAPSQKSLLAVAKVYRDYLKKNPESRAQEVAWHTFNRRTAFSFRLSLSSTSVTGLVDKLDSAIAKADKSFVVTIGTRTQSIDNNPKVLGIFTGQGAQWATMSRHLLLTNEVYANTIRALDTILKTCPDPPKWSLEQEILTDEDKSRVKEAAVSQPLCTALQLAMVDLLRHLGVTFHTVVGHSSGEIAAAYAAGKISLREAMLISHWRGMGVHMAHGVGGAQGGMLAVGISKDEAAELCAKEEFVGRLWVAASNSPMSVTLSGDLDAVNEACEYLTQGEKFARTLFVDKAYHSPHMEPASAKYLECLTKIGIVPSAEGNGTIWVSTVTGKGEPKAEELVATYWKDNMVQPVLFYEAVSTALETLGPFDCAIEVGPHPALKGPLTQTVTEKLDAALPYSSLLERKKDDREAFADFLGWLWTHFGSTSSQIRQFVLGSKQPELVNTRLTDLPLYPWDHSQSFYRESRISRQYHHKTDGPHELLGVRTRDDNKHQMRWRNILKYEKLPWAKHHSFQGQALLPASAYLIMTVDAARVALGDRKASIIELRNLKFPSGIILEPDTPGVEILFTLTIEMDDQETFEASFTLTSVIADGRTDMKKSFSGNLSVVLEEPNVGALPSRPADRAETLHASPDAFYDMMAGTGLVYTSPFKGLQTLERRYNFSSGTLKKYHDEDTTGLTISPATLDSCLQTAFVTISSPGDNAIWTSFLPLDMECVRFNLAICDIKDHNDTLAVDAYMTKATPFTSRAAASFTADIEIFNPKGEMEIQVQGLTVGSFSSIKPEEDYELYLTTRFNIDPDQEIVQAPDLVLNVNNPVLVESFQRVVSFYDGGEIASAWPNETQESLEKFIHGSPYFVALDFINEVGQNDPNALKDLVPSVIDEAQRLAEFQEYLGMVIRQIAHKYPRMNILALTDPNLGLTEHILAALDNSFQSFRLASEPEKNLSSRVHLTDALRKKITIDKLNLSAAELEKFNLLAYDLVIFVTSHIDEPANTTTVLKTLKTTMRPGGFLVLVDVSMNNLMDRFKRSSADSTENMKKPASPPDWPDVLESCGYTNSIENATQFFPAGFSLIVRHAESAEKRQLLHPLSTSIIKGKGKTSSSKEEDKEEEQKKLIKSLLIIGGTNPSTAGLIPRIKSHVEPFCTAVTTVPDLATLDLKSTLASSVSAVLLLSDLDAPVLAGMTQAGMDALRALFRPEMTFLWVTKGALFENPDAAASFGFARTLAAETPGLSMQVLDLEGVGLDMDCVEMDKNVETEGEKDVEEGSEEDEEKGGGKDVGEVVAETLVRLVRQVNIGENLVDDEKQTMLWVDEPEVHFDRGKRLVPRVLPWKESNDRVNAPRRVVSKAINTLENVVEIAAIGNGFEAKVENSYAEVIKDVRMLQIDYSIVNTVGLNTYPASQLCIGRSVKTGKTLVGLSDSNASYITTPFRRVSVVNDRLSPAVVLALVGRYLAAHVVAKVDRDEMILVVNPDKVFLECLEDVLLERGSNYLICLSDATLVAAARGNARLLHPGSTPRDIKALYPPEGQSGWVFDMSPKGSKTSNLLRETMPMTYRYSHYTALLNLNFHIVDRCDWNSAVNFAIARAVACKSDDDLNIMTVPDLLQSNAPVQPFQMIDWRAERTVSQTIKPLAGTRLLTPNKTYVLVGLTRDFGQSLCTLFVQQGARHIVLCSRNPPKDQPQWQKEMIAKGIKVQFRSLDVTKLDKVIEFKKNLNKTLPPVGGVVNGAMVLDDRVFSQMSLETLHRVMNPKTIGSKNLDIVFDSPDLDFFIMTSSFAAIGGHAGQSNYAAANMYMNGLAAHRRRRGLPGSVLNIGVIYGLGFLHREKDDLYEGLEREGYPPISERDIHHMFVEAIAAGKPDATVYDITTGLRRFFASAPTLHWHSDPRFSHFVRREEEDDAGAGDAGQAQIKDLLAAAKTIAEVTDVLVEGFITRLQAQLHLPEGAVTREHTIAELGVDSLAAVEIRAWAWKSLGQDVAVLKILGGVMVGKLCEEIAGVVMKAREMKKEDGEEGVKEEGGKEKKEGVEGKEAADVEMKKELTPESSPVLKGGDKKEGSGEKEAEKVDLEKIDEE